MNESAQICSTNQENFIKRAIKGICTFFSFKKDFVNLLKIHGTIGKMPGHSSCTFESISPLIENAFKNQKAKAVIISVNSPGGSPVQCEMIFKKIRQMSKKTSIPVYTFAEDLAASAGYWILCSGDEVYACNSSIVGSIGVIAGGFGLSEMIKKIGVERRVYPIGKYKDFLDSFQPEKPEHIEILKDIQQDAFEYFKSFVMDRRSEKLKLGTNDLFEGKVWTGKKAKTIGLIDGIKTYEEFIYERYGEKTSIVKIKSQSWIANKIGLITESVINSIFSNYNIFN